MVVDLLHEFELGVWKGLFTHLIRLLHASPDGQRRVDDLNARYRQTPTFSGSTIRQFANNAADMKKLAARDFEDLLQVTYCDGNQRVSVTNLECSVPSLHSPAFLMSRTTKGC